MSEKSSFIMYADVIEYTADLTDAQMGQLYRAQLQYANGIEPDIQDPEVKGIWRVIRHRMDLDTAKYEAKREQMRANASKSKQKQADATESQQTESVTDTVTDTVLVVPTVLEENSPKGEQKKRFQKPSADDVKAYCAQQNYAIDVGAFMAFYDSNGWRVGRNPMKDWKAAVRTWAYRNKGQPRGKPTGFSNFEQRTDSIDVSKPAFLEGL